MKTGYMLGSFRKNAQNYWRCWIFSSNHVSVDGGRTLALLALQQELPSHPKISKVPTGYKSSHDIVSPYEGCWTFKGLQPSLEDRMWDGYIYRVTI